MGMGVHCAVSLHGLAIQRVCMYVHCNMYVRELCVLIGQFHSSSGRSGADCLVDRRADC